MIIYGIKYYGLGNKKISGTQCDHCNSQDSLILHAFAKCVHVYWIPIMPIGKTIASECEHCKHSVDYKDMKGDLKVLASQAKESFSYSWKNFIGSVLIVLIVVAIFVWSVLDDKKDEEYIAHPIVGDMYTIDLGSGSYSLDKVVATDSDKITILHNTYQTSSSDTSEINKPENFTGESESLSFKELKDLYAQGVISEIDR